MIRFFRAIVWLRWRIMINSIRGARGRDAAERASRISAVVVPAALILLVLPTCLALAAGAFFGGWLMAGIKPRTRW